MKYLVLAMAAVSGLAIAAPATAQSQYPYPNQSQYPYPANANAEANFSARFDAWIDRIEERLEAGIDAGTINRTESRSLRTQLRTVTRLERQYAYNGFTQQERQDLQRRMRTLRQDLRMADGNAYRNERYGSRDDEWGDDDGYNGRGGPYDQDGDGWDDRDCDRDGDVDNGSCDTGAGRTGLGGFIDSILGGGGLRVGQRVNGELYAVPSQYRDRYRDGAGYYYRSDGRRIYQIDARTNVVARVYPM